MYIVNNKSHWADELLCCVCSWQTVQGIHPCDAFIFRSLVKKISKIFSCLDPTPTRAPMGWNLAWHARQISPPQSVQRVAPVGRKESKSPPPHRTNYAVVLSARNAANNNGRGRSHMRWAALVKTQEAFLPAQLSSARHGQEFSVSDLCRQKDTPAIGVRAIFGGGLSVNQISSYSSNQGGNSEEHIFFNHYNVLF